jgi:hypothetical protein
MDWQTGFNVVLSVAAFGMGTLAKIIWDTLTALRVDMKSLSDSVKLIERSLPETYVRRDDFKEHAQRVLAVLDRIEAKVNEKADK